jgi:alpha-tubulin suppressor-like RCC1 family protein
MKPFTTGRLFCVLKLLVSTMVVFLLLPASAYCKSPKVTAGGAHNLILTQTGAVWAWGSNAYGQLGTGTNNDRAFPAIIQGVKNVQDIACGERHSLALMADGTVRAWGGNNHGQLGNGTTADSSVSVKVLGLSSVVAVASGWYHSVALRGNGTVWTWGRNCEGQLGDGTQTDRNEPFQIPNLSDVIAVAAGWGHSMALKKDGTVWAWGNNRSGQLGNGDAERTPQSAPVQVNGSKVGVFLSGIVSISCGGWHSVAVAKDGSLWTWGGNSEGQLGNNNIQSSGVNLPVQVQDANGSGYFTNVLSVSAGWTHTLALQRGSHPYPGPISGVRAWGASHNGQVGNGTYDIWGMPLQIPLASPFPGETVVSVAAGFYHSVALGSQGSVWTWGDNSCGQIGDGTNTPRPSPKRLSVLMRPY